MSRTNTIVTLVVFPLCLLAGFGCGNGESANVGTAAGASAGPETARESFSVLQPGQIVPPYEVRSLDGAPVGIGAGQPLTLLNLWATWCAPCREEFPDLEELHLELKDHGLRVLAVDIDAESPQTLRAVAEQLSLTLPIARDTSGQIQQVYANVGVPTSYLLSASGELVRSWTGIIPKEEYAFIKEYVESARG